MIMLSDPGWVGRKVIAHRSSTRSRERKEPRIYIRERVRARRASALGSFHTDLRAVIHRENGETCCFDEKLILRVNSDLQFIPRAALL